MTSESLMKLMAGEELTRVHFNALLGTPTITAHNMDNRAARFARDLLYYHTIEGTSEPESNTQLSDGIARILSCRRISREYSADSVIERYSARIMRFPYTYARDKRDAGGELSPASYGYDGAAYTATFIIRRILNPLPDVLYCGAVTGMYIGDVDLQYAWAPPTYREYTTGVVDDEPTLSRVSQIVSDIYSLSMHITRMSPSLRGGIAHIYEIKAETDRIGDHPQYGANHSFVARGLESLGPMPFNATLIIIPRVYSAGYPPAFRYVIGNPWERSFNQIENVHDYLVGFDEDTLRKNTHAAERAQKKCCAIQ